MYKRQGNRLLQQNSPEHLSRLLESLNYSLRLLAQLPPQYRQSLRAKIKLAHAILNTPPVSHNEVDAQHISLQLQSEPHSLWQYAQEPADLQRLLRDSKSFVTNLAEHDLETITHLIDTGLEFTEISDSVIPDPKPEDLSLPLIDQLATIDNELGAIARIARQVIGFLSLPKPASLQLSLIHI